MKTARFTELVQKAGAPKNYLLWIPPNQDPVFQRAVKEQRILTIHQENVGTKKDYGMVGFHEEPTAQFLVFPKSLKAYVDRRVVGINYDLLAQETPTAKTRAVPQTISKKQPSVSPKPEPATKNVLRTEREEPEEKIVAFETPVPKTETKEKESGKPAEASSKERARTKPKAVETAKSKNPPTPEKLKPPKLAAPEKPATRERAPQPAKADEPKNAAEPEKPVELPKARLPENEPTTGSTPESRILAVVRRAMKDLDEGKAVAAYKKLEALVAEADKSGDDSGEV